jgi:hypothetical protein
MGKKLTYGVFAAILAMVGLVSSHASAAPATTAVTGVVTKNQMAVEGASVTVLCQGNTETDTTDAQGSYLVTYPIASCPFGSTVKVTAQKNGESGTNSGTVQGYTTKLNLAIVDVPIPEFGAIGALAAGAAGIGLVMVTRRRKLSRL